MSFEIYKKLTSFLKVPDPIHVNFSSISSPIYKKKSSEKHQGFYFESLLFAFLQMIQQNHDLKKYQYFKVFFEESLEYLNDHFLVKKEIQEMSDYVSYEEMKNDLVHYVRSYEVVFFGKEFNFSLENYINSRKKSQNRFHLILKILLMSEIYQLNDKEVLKDNKKKLNDFFQSIQKETYDDQDPFLNLLIATIFKTDIKIYRDGHDLLSFQFYGNTEKSSNKINLFRDKIGYYRLLSDRLKSFVDEKELLEHRFRKENENLLRQIKSIKNYQKNHEREILFLRKLYEHSLKISNNITKGYMNYIELLTEPEREKKFSTKFSTRKKLKKNFSAIKTYEKRMRKKNFKVPDSEEKLSKIIKNLENLPEKMGIYLDKYTEASDLEKDQTLCEGEDEISLISESKFKSKLPSQIKKKRQPFSDNIDVGEIIKRSETFIKCFICEDEVTINEIKTFDCDCRFCNDCMKGLLQARYDTGKYDLEIPCPCANTSACKGKNKGVGPPTSQYMIKELLGEEMLDKIEILLVKRIADKKCSNPNCNFHFVYQEDIDMKFFLCNECKTETCVKCWNQRHPKKKCTKIDETLKKIMVGKRLRVCPNCLTPGGKDPKCDHVTCVHCNLEWCFNCSIARKPTLAHANHYHRTDCKFFKPNVNNAGIENNDDKFEKNCPECLKLGRVCPQPMMTTKEFYESKDIDQFIIDNLECEEDFE